MGSYCLICSGSHKEVNETREYDIFIVYVLHIVQHFILVFVLILNCVA